MELGSIKQDIRPYSLSQFLLGEKSSKLRNDTPCLGVELWTIPCQSQSESLSQRNVGIYGNYL